MLKYFIKRFFEPQQPLPEEEFAIQEVTKDEYIRIGLTHNLISDDIPENALMYATKNNVCHSATHIFWVEDVVENV